MQSARRSSARPVWHVGWCLPLMLGFVLVRPNALLQAASNITAVADAAKADDLPAVRKLIKEHADVRTAANDGSTGLLWAAFHSNAEMTKELLAAGAKVDAATHSGVTPLLQASRNGDVEVMRALLDAGAQPTRWHAEGETPLMAASRTGRVDAVQLLLSKGSFVNAADPFQEETALMWASAEGHLGVVKALIAVGEYVKNPFVDELASTTLCLGAATKTSPLSSSTAAADIEVLKLMLAPDANIEWSPSEVKPKDGKGPARPNPNLGRT